ncbi:uncharacterized protein Dh44 [Drosophila tropicalis]|uniref:uncharacterized protein Dh44 n=1 Tax=Drosophila tropicalis TaxID=46794 RepID=UPI0035AC2581
MMKATAWFCPVILTLLCATRLVCTAQRGGGRGGASGNNNGYPLDYLDDAQAIQDDYLLWAKRNKPSLSIVNPLDVLRQRLLLEIARRQMKENTRQVELNRAILKNVGKRVFVEPRRSYQLASVREQQLQHFPSQLWSLSQSSDPSLSSPVFPASSSSLSSPSSSRFFDFLQRAQSQPRPRTITATEQEAEAEAASAQQKSLNVLAKHQSNGNEIANETNHENGHGQSATSNAVANNMDVESQTEQEQEQDRVLTELEDNLNWANEEPNDIAVNEDNANVVSRHLPWRLLYGQHKHHHYAN